MTKSIFKNVLAWAQDELNHQLTKKKMQPRPAYIVNLPGVKVHKDKIYAAHRDPPPGEFTDLQADLFDDVGAENMLKLVDMCLKIGIPNESQRGVTSGFFCLQALFELRAGHQMCSRHDETREEKLCHMFTKVLKKAGPESNMRIMCNISNGGKRPTRTAMSSSPAACRTTAKSMCPL